MKDLLRNQVRIIICFHQFQVIRKRYQWKFVLKDGIMMLNGKDYVFGRGKGESMTPAARNEELSVVVKK